MAQNILRISICAAAWIWLQADVVAEQPSPPQTQVETDSEAAGKTDESKQEPDGGDSPEYSQHSARAAMRTFIVAMEHHDLRAATAVLDFSQMTPAPDAYKQIEYAKMLKACIDRIALVDGDLINDDPDGPEQRFPPDNSEPFLMVSKGEDQQWRFSSSTIEELPALFEVLKDKPPIGQVEAVEQEPDDVSSPNADPTEEEESQEKVEDSPRISMRVPDHLESARRVMRTLFASMEQKDYPLVVSALDYSKLELEEPNLGPYAKLELARRLKAVIERMEDFSYGEISDDPQGEAFYFPTDQASQPISISRGENGIWRFSADTVADINALYEVYHDREVLFLTGEKRVWFHRELFMGNEVWQILLLFGAIFLGLLLGQTVRKVALWRADQLKRRDRLTASLTLETIAKTVPAIALLIGLAAGLDNLTLGFQVELFTGTILHIALTLVVGYICFRLVDVVVGFLREVARRSGSTLNDMLAPIVSTSLRLTILLLVLLEIATAVSQQPPSALIAGLGAGGLAIGLAAQDTIKNFFGSVMIFADRPFELGDRIVIDGHDGPVESVGFRSTRIRTLDGHLVTVPNGEMAHRTIHNIGRRPYIRRIMNIRIAYGTAPETVQKALDIVRELLDQHEGYNEDYPPRVFLHDFLDSAVNIRAIYWYHPPAYWDFCNFGEQLNLRIMERFREAGIEFALPARKLFVSEDSQNVGDVHD